ncbi:MAG TPA: hypothetical protein VFY05_02980 [Candidatus Angelobacter sp.]|nr:hypothetical protein [Candidatus Angelobacter sp.]
MSDLTTDRLEWASSLGEAREQPLRTEQGDVRKRRSTKNAPKRPEADEPADPGEETPPHQVDQLA